MTALLQSSIDQSPSEFPEPWMDGIGDDIGDWNDDGGDDGHGGGNGRWITLCTYWQPTDAHIARLKLESDDIDCVIFDENLVATDWLWAIAAGGIKLQVREEDQARAAESLQRRPGATQQDLGAPSCATCEREVENCRPGLRRKLAMLSILLIGAPLPLLGRWHSCAECGRTVLD